MDAEDIPQHPTESGRESGREPTRTDKMHERHESDTTHVNRCIMEPVSRYSDVPANPAWNQAGGLLLH